MILFPMMQVLVQGSTGVMVTRPSLSDQSEPSLRRIDQSEPSSVPSISRQPSLDTTANLLAANPLGGGLQSRNRSITSNSSVTPAATPSPHGLKNSVLSQPSPGIVSPTGHCHSMRLCVPAHHLPGHGPAQAQDGHGVQAMRLPFH